MLALFAIILIYHSIVYNPFKKKFSRLVTRGHCSDFDDLFEQYEHLQLEELKKAKSSIQILETEKRDKSFLTGWLAFAGILFTAVFNLSRLHVESFVVLFYIAFGYFTIAHAYYNKMRSSIQSHLILIDYLIDSKSSSM